ncbi:p21-C-terminal region-binding protein-domain-containing protein [Zopfochytrium polystomum]|nr:p21-C-terminal region-binding protein-domain-containing protein [Zopfochytrium polystomum]
MVARKRKNPAAHDDDDDDAENERADDVSGASETPTGHKHPKSNPNDPLSQLIDVDFDFQDISQIDFHGLKSLIRQAFVGTEVAETVDLSGIADAIIENGANGGVGTVVKVDDATDPYAVMTVLSFKNHKALLDPLSNMLIARSRQSSSNTTLESLLAGKHVAYLVNERLVNMPPQVVPDLFRLLLDELKKRKSTIAYLLIISKTYMEVAPSVSDDDDANDSAPKKKKKKTKAEKSPVFCIQVEDEIFQEHSVMSFELPISREKKDGPSSGGSLTEAGIIPGRRVLLVEMSKADTIMNQMRAILV